MTKKTLLLCAALFLGAVAFVAWGSDTDRSLLLLLVALACPLLHVVMHGGHRHGRHAGTDPTARNPGEDSSRTGA